MGAKRVLIITYYWPPGGGAGVQRWLKFVKYLPQFGWSPVVYTPENGEMPVLDASLEKDIPLGTEIIRTRIWEPYSIYKTFVGVGKDEKINTGFLTEKKKPGLAERLSVWLRGNFFIPDARKFWIKPSVKYLSTYLSQNPVDAIVSTGPPHSMHLIALQISNKFNIPWVADFRDPWTNIDYYKDLMLTNGADKKHHLMEHEVLTKATRVIVVGKTMQQEFMDDFHRKIDVITNGFDEDDSFIQVKPISSNFMIAHVGTIVRSRNPKALWKALDKIINEVPGFADDLEIRLTGKVDIEVRNSLKDNNLEKFVTYTNYLPHAEVALEQQKASLLLLILNDTPNAKGILTGKMFEYMAAKRPVLCIGPINGDAASILDETGSGKTFNFDDKEGLLDAIKSYYSQFKSGNLTVDSRGIQQYSRKSLTKKLVEVLEEITKK